MSETKRSVTMKGDPLTLVGNEAKVGQPAPDVELVGTDLSPVKVSSFQGKALILSAVPSLDTSVCSKETKRFNDEAASLGEDIEVVTVSMDLPFAQKRWAEAEGVDKIETLSDHREAAFGEAYGVLIEELRLLARTVFVVDKQGVIRYIELVDEVTDEPDYDAALNAARELTA